MDDETIDGTEIGPYKGIDGVILVKKTTTF